MDVDSSSSSSHLPDEESILKRPWAEQLINELSDMARIKTLEWCQIVIQLGEEYVEREQWCDVFQENVEKIYTSLVGDARRIQVKVLNEIEEHMTRITYACKQLGLSAPEMLDRNLVLYEDLHRVEKLAEEYEEMIQVRKKEIDVIKKRQDDVCKALGLPPKTVSECPLPTSAEMDKLREHVEKLEEEKFKREELYLTLKNEIMEMAFELQYRPNLDFENEILSKTNVAFSVSTSDMDQLKAFHAEMLEQMDKVKEEVSNLRTKVDELWNILEESMSYRDTFTSKHTGNSLVTLEALKEEVKRCDNLKKQNIQTFVEKCRKDLLTIWKKCHCDSNQKYIFRFFDSTDYNEDLLELHQFELRQWQNYYEENKQLLQLIGEHNAQWEKMLQLEKNSQEPGRYKNRGGQLLKEEKERNKLSKKIPDIEAKMLELAAAFEEKNGKVFTTFGRTVDEHLAHLRFERDTEKKLKLSARKQLREQATFSTPAKCVSNLFKATSTQNLAIATPVSAKRRLLAPQSESKKIRTENGTLTTPRNQTVFKKSKTPVIVVTQSSFQRSKRLSQERAKRLRKARRLSSKSSKTSKNKENLDGTDYKVFEEALSSRENQRSTLSKEEIFELACPSTCILNTPRTPQQRTTPGNFSKSPRSTRSKLMPAPSLKLLF